MCGVLREMDVTGFRTTGFDKTGIKTSVLTRAYHCRSCSCFVRCEEVEDTQQNRENVILDADEVFLRTSVVAPGVHAEFPV
jgi:hypothetical protein